LLWQVTVNNLPSGPRYVLNVIAFDNCPAGDFTDSNRHMIAVKANFTADGSGDLTSTQAGKLASEMIRTNTIALVPGDDFRSLMVMPAIKVERCSDFLRTRTPVHG